MICWQNKCSSSANKWACINDNITDCYVPNSLRKTCGIRGISPQYNDKYRTCGCDDPTMEPCTESEVKMLAHDWMGYFKDHYQGKGGLILLRNMGVMEDSGTIYTDFGVATGCTRSSEYKGIFCRGEHTPLAVSLVVF